MASTGDRYGNDAMYAEILRGIGAPVTKGNLLVMRAWHASEGGPKVGAFNPFNTTQVTDRNGRPLPHTAAPGSKVASYPDASVGVAATIATLENGYYDEVVRAFKQGNATAAIRAIVSSPWAGGHYNATVINGQYSVTSSTIWKVFQQYDPDAEPPPDAGGGLGDNLWPDDIGGILPGIGDAITPDNLNPLDAIRNAIAPLVVLSNGIQFLATHWQRFMMGSLGLLLIVGGVILARRGDIGAVVDAAKVVV